jgi:hypothetical protein
MIQLGDVWINPALITSVRDQPEEDRLVISFAGDGWLAVKGASRQRMLALLHARHGGALGALQELETTSQASLARKEGGWPTTP